MTEKHSFKHGFRDGRTVDCNERLIRASTAAVDEIRKDFLTRSCGTIDKDRNVAVSNPISQGNDRQGGWVSRNRALSRICHSHQGCDAAVGDRVTVG